MIFGQTWSPYLVGVGIGILSWISFLVSKKPLGTSTAYARTSGILSKGLCPVCIESKAYYEDKAPPEIDWQWMLVVGIIIGSFFSAVLYGEFRVKLLPATDYESVLNMTLIGRYLSALVGGILIGFGARWAGGCTSGHGISGTLQLSISSWIAVICFFAGGVVTAAIIFG